MDEKPLIPGIGRGKTSTGLVSCGLNYVLLHFHGSYLYEIKIGVILVVCFDVSIAIILCCDVFNFSLVMRVAMSTSCMY